MRSKPATVHTTMVSGRLRGSVTCGRPTRDVSPRTGIDFPMANNVTTMTMNGSAFFKPYFAHSGHQDRVLDKKTSSAWSAPRANAPPSAHHSDWSRAISATASAGTTSSVSPPAVSTPVAGPARISTSDENTVDRTQVIVPRNVGERRANIAARSSSAAARSARPVTDARAQIARTAPSTATTAISQIRSTGTGKLAMVTVPDGSTELASRDSVPYFKATAADNVVSTPIDATTLATAGAARSGRDTSSSTAAPTAAATASEMSTCTQVGICPTSHGPRPGSGSVSWPARRSLNTNNDTVAIAAAAKLIVPAPWNVRTIPIDKPAYTAPVPSPRMKIRRYWLTRAPPRPQRTGSRHDHSWPGFVIR